jgi:hypothetical protein
LHYSYIKVSVDEAVHSELVKLIKCDFNPGSVERSIDLYKRGYTSAVELKCLWSSIPKRVAITANKNLF